MPGNVKVVALCYGGVFLLVGIGMGLAEAFFGWAPTTTDILIRGGLLILGLIGLSVGAMSSG